jgi:integrase
MSGTLASAMPRQATGSIETHRWRDGRTLTFRARFRAYGRRWRIDFGTNHEGWNEERARVELERIMGQVARGTWEPPSPAAPVELDRDETLHVTASRWWQRRERELAENTRLDYRWRLDHILRHLARTQTAEIDARRVDDFRQKLHARGLSPRSVNMALDVLAQVLDDAVEYGLLDANPARGRRRRMKVAKSRRTFLEQDQVVDLLDVAGEWERELPAHQQYGRRALLATLCLAGPRISELTSAPRARLDLHGGRLRVGEAKTEAGLRDIELTFFLQAELREHLAHLTGLGRPASAAAPIFPTYRGGRHNASNVRNRLLAECVARANARREAAGKMLLPDKVTPHTLRRTFASLALAAGRDPRWVMAQLGHTDARLTLNVYAQVMQRQRIDEALIWQLMRFPDEPEERSFGPRNGPTRTLPRFDAFAPPGR